MSYKQQPAAKERHESRFRISVALPNVEMLPLRLNPFVLSNRFIPRKELLRRLGAHYRTEAFRQVHRILLGVARAHAAGGVLQAPVELGKGVAAQAHGIAKGLRRGIAGGLSLAGMVTTRGASMAPAAATDADTAAAAYAAAAHAAAAHTDRTPRRPTVAVAAWAVVPWAAAAAAESLQGRQRLPRMLHGSARELRLYTVVEALGWHLLHSIARAQYASEPLVCCVAAREPGCLLLLTDLRLLLASPRASAPIWQLPLLEINEMRYARSDGALVLGIAPPFSSSKGSALAQVRERRVACIDEPSMTTLREAVRELLSQIC